MLNRRAPDLNWNPWKWTAIGMAVIFATALITGVVVAHYAGGSNTQVAAVPPDAALSQQDLRPQNAQSQDQRPQSASAPAAAPPPLPPGSVSNGRAPEHHVRARLSSADIEDCTRSASNAHDQMSETLQDVLLGAAAGAGLGAAGGAIAGGGRAAGTGAGIGSLVGAGAGTVYGLTESSRQDARAAASYRACMRHRGYTD